MQRINRSEFPTVFSNYIKTINHMFETRFYKQNFKESDGFLKYVKLSDKLSGPKLWNSYLTMEEKILSQLPFLDE